MDAEILHEFEHIVGMFIEEEFSVGIKFLCLRKFFGLHLLEAEGTF